MKIDKVTYQKTYSIGPYLTDRVGFEASIDDDEDTPENVLSQLEEIADQWHKYVHPHLYDADKLPANVNDEFKVHQPIIIDKSIERLEVAIDNCQSIEELDQLKKDNPLFPARLLESFNKKRKELSNV